MTLRLMHVSLAIAMRLMYASSHLIVKDVFRDNICSELYFSHQSGVPVYDLCSPDKGHHRRCGEEWPKGYRVFSLLELE